MLAALYDIAVYPAVPFGLCTFVCKPCLSVCRYVGDDALFMTGAPIRNVVYVVGVREAGLQAALDTGTVTGPGKLPLWSSTDVDPGVFFLHGHVCICVRMLAPNFSWCVYSAICSTSRVGAH